MLLDAKTKCLNVVWIKFFFHAVTIHILFRRVIMSAQNNFECIWTLIHVFISDAVFVLQIICCTWILNDNGGAVTLI